MSESPDVAKIEAALKRAAYKAMHGTREERSGRFLLKRKPAPRADKAASRKAVRKGRA